MHIRSRGDVIPAIRVNRRSVRAGIESGAPGLVFITASGLLFGAGRDIQIRAWDSDTGVQLWASRLGGEFVGSPVMYEMAGRQYLLVPAAARCREAPALVRGRRSAGSRTHSRATDHISWEEQSRRPGIVPFVERRRSRLDSTTIGSTSGAPHAARTPRPRQR